MNPATTLLIALAVLTLAGSAQDQPVPVPELETLKKEHASLVTTADRPYLTAVAELEKRYLAGLEREQAAAQRGGKMDESLALDGEKKAITSGGKVPAEDDAKTPPVLRKMHASYRAESAKLEQARDLTRTKNFKPLRDDYVAKLDALVLRLTKDGKLKEAMTVRKFRENLPAAPVALAGITQNQAAGKVMSVNLPGGVVMKFCYCPPGNFKMGSPPDEMDRQRNEDQVQVQLSKGFWLAQTECTQAQWVAVMGHNPSKFKGDDLPVEQVSWNDAQQFITKLNEAMSLPAGWKVALPTEAQWEYACRAGTKTAFSFGKTFTTKQANFAYVLGKTRDVGKYKTNPWGLHDMHGNVLEWCGDWLGEKLPGGTDPTGAPSGTARVWRGGGWLEPDDYCRAAFRNGNKPDTTWNAIGFRVALVAVP
jgi:formylglycine-generating enzyme required for sulfatase activity